MVTLKEDSGNSCKCAGWLPTVITCLLFLGSQRRAHEQSLQDRREEQTMTGLSLRSRQSVEKKRKRHHDRNITRWKTGNVTPFHPWQPVARWRHAFPCIHLRTSINIHTYVILTHKQGDSTLARSQRVSVSSKQELFVTSQGLHSDSHHSFVSRGVSPFPIMESSTQEDTVGEDHVEYRGVSPRDSGFEGAGSSVKFDSRPVSGSSNVNVLSPQMETEEEVTLSVCMSVIVHPYLLICLGSLWQGKALLGSRSSTLTAPPRQVLMSARARRRLVNSALRDHPVASEILRTYEAVQRFKGNMTEWLEKQGLFVEVSELTNFETNDLNKVCVVWFWIKLARYHID